MKQTERIQELNNYKLKEWINNQASDGRINELDPSVTLEQIAYKVEFGTFRHEANIESIELPSAETLELAYKALAHIITTEFKCQPPANAFGFVVLHKLRKAIHDGTIQDCAEQFDAFDRFISTMPRCPDDLGSLGE